MMHLKPLYLSSSGGLVGAALRVFGGDAREARVEHERLRFLRALQLLDTAREPFLDALICAAAAVANTPIAALSLIDADRQWFKGARGLDVSETPLDVSFCRHTIERGVPTIVPDARLDPRFANNKAVTGDMHVQFYAGFPLVVHHHAIGALCVVDDHPRRLETYQMERLAQLAAGAVAWIGQHATRLPT